MARSKLVVQVLTALVLSAFSISCSSADGGSMSPTSPTPTPTVTVSLSTLLNPEARSMFSVGATVFRARAGDTFTIYSQFPKEDTLAGAANWTPRTGVGFVVVDKQEGANIVILQALPTAQGSDGGDACGDAYPLGSNSLITGGVIRVAFGLSREACNVALRSHIAHELGHVLGFGHSPAGRDEMSPSPRWNAGPTPALDDAAKWYYTTAPIGAIIVQ